MPDDFKRIKQFLAGNESAFDDLVKSHRIWVEKFIEKIIKNPQDTKDLSQDIFIKVYFNLANFRFDSKFKTWLYRIIVNQINNYFRRKKLRAWYNLEYDEQQVCINNYSIDSTGHFPLQEIIKTLPKVQRCVVLLRIFQDLPFKQVSEILTISENSAKVSFYKARHKLKGYFNEPL